MLYKEDEFLFLLAKEQLENIYFKIFYLRINKIISFLMIYISIDDNQSVDMSKTTGKMMNISIKLIDNGSEYIANCPELDINCYGSDKDEAMRRIRVVINFYINSAKELGISINPLKDISFNESEIRHFSCMMTQNNSIN